MNEKEVTSIPAEFARKLERERDAWKAKYIQQNKDLGCEMMDPNGTIWDYAKNLQKEQDMLLKRLDETQERMITAEQILKRIYIALNITHSEESMLSALAEIDETYRTQNDGN